MALITAERMNALIGTLERDVIPRPRAERRVAPLSGPFTLVERHERAAPITSAQIAALADALEASREDFGITTPQRCAFLMGQLCYESAGFRQLSENLNYSASRISVVWPRLAKRANELSHNPEALANAAYANRYGNGDEESGDGWLFHGRGLIQITFRDNYTEAGDNLGVDLTNDPDQVAQPDIASKTALSFWNTHGCNEAADTDDVGAVTALINSALEGLSARDELTQKAKGIFT